MITIKEAWEFLYIVPLGLSLTFVVIMALDKYRIDIKRRATNSQYVPGLTLGEILGNLLMCGVPIVNILIVVVELVPSILSKMDKLMVRLIAIPIVPPLKKVENDKIK